MNIVIKKWTSRTRWRRGAYHVVGRSVSLSLGRWRHYPSAAAATEQCWRPAVKRRTAACWPHKLIIRHACHILYRPAFFFSAKHSDAGRFVCVSFIQCMHFSISHFIASLKWYWIFDIDATVTFSLVYTFYINNTSESRHSTAEVNLYHISQHFQF